MGNAEYENSSQQSKSAFQFLEGKQMLNSAFIHSGTNVHVKEEEDIQAVHILSAEDSPLQWNMSQSRVWLSTIIHLQNRGVVNAENKDM